MELIFPEENENIWPIFTDIVIAVLLLLTLFVFVKFISTSEALRWRFIQIKQNEVSKSITENPFLKEKIHNKKIEIKIDGSRQRFRFSDEILFESGQAILNPQGMHILSLMGQILMNNKNFFSQIQVEGHTDNIPINNEKFQNNWELSSARAISVVRYLLTKFKLDPQLFSANGYAEYNPINTTDTPEGRRKNRRIEIVLFFSQK